MSQAAAQWQECSELTVSIPDAFALSANKAWLESRAKLPQLAQRHLIVSCLLDEVPMPSGKIQESE